MYPTRVLFFNTHIDALIHTYTSDGRNAIMLICANTDALPSLLHPFDYTGTRKNYSQILARRVPAPIRRSPGRAASFFFIFRFRRFTRILARIPAYSPETVCRRGGSKR